MRFVSKRDDLCQYLPTNCIPLGEAQMGTLYDYWVTPLGIIVLEFTLIKWFIRP
ncbi:MAG: hypothetical protein H0U95_19265 [Bacteroidetes bacterium]|nr:hypothetical protein [Bacteroidota bacterium]